ncbi:hypothetical protein APB26_32360 [Pseudomonas aeruginosa]|uniref:hypothetical protein n=1 Tax=Pseudomonas aeruginosa TaxID=287 RepID=UPI00071BFF11|nr:hypothetical protein [Pseudomonas aeruginosa]KSQ21677.1 hypothetical protein APB26_32360 [Pseudomonas aeruginosa]RPV61347.1 hypothetical protein IPC838_18685 [Pseudomonas aeruginosa]
MSSSIIQHKSTWRLVLPLNLLTGCLSLGLLGGWLFAQSVAGLAALVPLSGGLAWALVRLSENSHRQFSAALWFCGGIAVSSAKFSEIVGFYLQGLRALAVSEIPELLICVVLPPFIAMIVVKLAYLVLSD